MSEEKQISAVQRAQNFAAATRQNLHMLPSRTITNLGESVQFNYPKSRLLSKTFVKFDIKYNNKGSNVIDIKNTISPYSLIRRISLSLNNGFEPFVINGRDLALLNMVRMKPETIESKYDSAMYAQNSGLIVVNESKETITFMIELENALNQRDASSLILLQNESTNVTLSIDITTNFADVCTVKDIDFESVKITPMLQTWTIPNFTDAFPDLSVLKLVKSRTETLPNAGEHILKLDVGTIYRKLVFYVTDDNGNGVDLINSNIELIYNTADTPISIDPEMLKLKNASDFGYNFPKGMYVFDFSGYAGFSNYGGTRDFIDTERLTEFWVRFSTSSGCKVTTIQENLTRLR